MDDLIDVYAVLEQIETIATLCTECGKNEKDADDILYAIKNLATHIPCGTVRQVRLYSAVLTLLWLQNT